MVYDLVRLEEKAIIEAAKKRSQVELKTLDSKDLHFDLLGGKDLKEKFGNVCLQRCASYFRNLHLTAVL